MNNPVKKTKKTGCFVLLIIIALIVIPVIYFVFFHIKTTDIYKCAIREAKKNPQITGKIGDAVEEGFLVWLDEYSAGRFSEEAHFNTSLKGTKGSGTLYVRALKDIQYSSMTLIFEKDGVQEIVHSGVYPCQ